MKRINLFLWLAAGLIGMTGCDRPASPDQLINSQASLPASFRLSDRHRHVISSFINKRKQTMSVLYGDKAALETHGAETSPNPGLQTLTLVTWRQQDDPHWFGARIPGELLTVEQLEVQDTTGSRTFSYQKLAGRDLSEVTDTTGRSARIRFMLAQRPSITP